MRTGRAAPWEHGRVIYGPAGSDGTDPLVAVSLRHRDAVPLLPGIIAGASGLLGADGVAGSRIGVLAEQVAEAIFADPFNANFDLVIDVEVAHCPGGLVVRLRDQGAPSTFARGELPSHIASLIGLGFADDLDASTQGREGNLTEIFLSLPYAKIDLDDSATEVPSADDDTLTFRPMELDDIHGVSRLFFRTYGYTYFHVPYVFEPERFREYVASGAHLATVAVNSAGWVVGHLASEISKSGSTTGIIGMLAVDPAYRGRGLGGQLGLAHYGLLIQSGYVGQYTEAFAAHDRSQRLALASGAHECGILLGRTSSTLEIRELVESSDERSSVVILFGSIAPIPHRTSYAPAPYAETIQLIYAQNSLDRELAVGPIPEPDALPARSRFSVHLYRDDTTARVTLQEYGRDFDRALQEQLAGFRRAGFEYVFLLLPLGDPLTSHFGAGLRQLGLSFAGIYPELQDGDWLAVQAPLALDTDVDVSKIRLASEFGQKLLDFVVADFREARATRAAHERSRTRLARAIEVLEDPAPLEGLSD